MRCSLCKGRKYVSAFDAGRWHAVPCGRCSGTGTEPKISLRELRRENQARLRREAEERRLREE